MIEIVDARKTYSLGKIRVPALKGISIAIRKGEFVSVMGPSGSGKSTLLNIIGCLDRLTDGSYMFEGAPITELDDDDLARIRNLKIGFVFQTFNLIARQTAIENVELPLLYAGMAHTSDKAVKALKEVGLGHRLHHRPSELSGGERQRVAIARAIVLEPSVILADEPTGNLDTATGREIIEIFKWLNNKGATVILVTHEKEVAGYGQRIIYIRDGTVHKDISSGAGGNR